MSLMSARLQDARAESKANVGPDAERNLVVDVITSNAEQHVMVRQARLFAYRCADPGIEVPRTFDEAHTKLI